MDILNYAYNPQNTKADLILKNLVNSFVKPLYFSTTPPAEQDPDKYQTAVFNERTGVESLLGRSVFATVTLETEAYELETFDAKSRTYTKVKMPSAKMELGTMLIDVNMTKNIVTTNINGLAGSVKEYISDGDFEVSLRGAIVNEKGYAYPTDAVKQFLAVMKAPVSLKVTSEYLALFPIHNLVVKDYTMPQTEGSSNTQLFEISALSDNPVELLKISL